MTTKFNVGDKVYFMHTDGSIKTALVNGITVNEEDGLSYSFRMATNDSRVCGGRAGERELSATVEEAFLNGIKDVLSCVRYNGYNEGYRNEAIESVREELMNIIEKHIHI